MFVNLDFTSQSGHLMKVLPEGLIKDEIPVEKEEPLRTEISSFIQCVRNHTEPKIDIHFGKKTLELALKITEIINLASQ